MTNYIFPEKTVIGGAVYVCVGELEYRSKLAYNNLVNYVHTDAFPLTKVSRRHNKGAGFSGLVAVYVMECFEDKYYQTLPIRLVKSNNGGVTIV